MITSRLLHSNPSRRLLKDSFKKSVEVSFQACRGPPRPSRRPQGPNTTTNLETKHASKSQGFLYRSPGPGGVFVYRRSGLQNTGVCAIIVARDPVKSFGLALNAGPRFEGSA